MKLTAKLAQGNDLPMALENGSSFYHAYGFPNQALQIFDRQVLMTGKSSKAIDRWKSDYLFQMKKTALISKKDRLVIRNASDTARIPQLLSLFPGAKFVHVVRNPLEMIPASIKRWSNLRRHWSLQNYDETHSFDFALQTGELLMRKFYKDKDQIPNENLHTVKFEDLIAEPITQLELLYKKLGLQLLSPEQKEKERLISQAAMAFDAGTTQDFDCYEAIRSRLGFYFEENGYVSADTKDMNCGDPQ